MPDPGEPGMSGRALPRLLVPGPVRVVLEFSAGTTRAQIAAILVAAVAVPTLLVCRVDGVEEPAPL